MTREDIENNVGYWQEKANLEYIRQRQEHGVNDPYMITEIDEAFDAGFDKGYQYAVASSTEKGGVKMRILKLMWNLWIRPLFCKHDYHFVRNLHGDEVRYHGWKRSVWRCSKCGKVRYENWYVAYRKEE